MRREKLQQWGARMSSLDDAIGKAEALLQVLNDAKARQVRAASDEPPLDENAHDNELPFKCPACGKTYAEQVTCTNGHAGEQTLPTADVLAGAEPGAEPVPTPPQVDQAVTEQTPVAPIAAVPDPPAPATPTTPADPPWPPDTA